MHESTAATTVPAALDGGVDAAGRNVDCPRRRMGSYAGYLVETFVTLLAVCGLAFVVLFGARRLGVGRPRGPIQLVGQLPLDARRAIYLVQVGEQVLVVGASEAGLTKLGEMPSQDLPAAVVSNGAPFGDILARVLGTATTRAEAAAKPAPANPAPAKPAPAKPAPAKPAPAKPAPAKPAPALAPAAEDAPE